MVQPKFDQEHYDFLCQNKVERCHESETRWAGASTLPPELRLDIDGFSRQGKMLYRVCTFGRLEAAVLTFRKKG